MLPPAITEMCHRLGLPEEFMAKLGVVPSYQVPEAVARDAVAMVHALGRLGHDAAEEAAHQLGWDEELVHKAVLPDEDEDDD